MPAALQQEVHRLVEQTRERSGWPAKKTLVTPPTMASAMPFSCVLSLCVNRLPLWRKTSLYQLPCFSANAMMSSRLHRRTVDNPRERYASELLTPI